MLNRDEIIEEAKRRYPKGTKHSGYKGGKAFIYQSDGEFRWSCDNLYSTGDGCIYFAKEERWAETDYTPPNYEIF